MLSERGLFYLVAVPENKPLEIIEQMKARGLEGEVSNAHRLLTQAHCRPSSDTDIYSSLELQIVLKRRAGREHLHILRFSRPAATASQP